MPSIISHPIVPLALGLALGKRLVSGPLLAAGMIASILPDLDVLAFLAGLPYAHDFGHRGASHSLACAASLGAIACALAAQLQVSRRSAFLFVACAATSHGLLDMLTNGGLGIALAWPLSGQRYFFPFQVIEVSPLGLRRFFSATGATVLASELLWIWLPSAAVGAAVYWRRRQ
jgi:inner membrane protein